MNAYEIGEKCYVAFKEERLEKDPPMTQCLPKKLKTFANLCKEVKSSGRTISLKADRLLFSRIVVMAQVRILKMEDVFSHPLGPLPWALSTPDRLLRKTHKAALATTLKKKVPVTEQLLINSTSVVDGMNIVKKNQR